jgi:cytochrome c oxidase subunit 2
MRFRTFLTGFTSLFAGGAAFAQELPIIGTPGQGKIGFQTAATELMRDIHWLDNMLLIIITAITLFVVALLVICVVKFNQKANPTPSTFTHNTPIEVAWTLVPVVVLIFIGAFSLPVLFKQQEIPEPEVFIKATGYQWYWGYEYPDHEIDFEGYMIGVDSGNELTPETSQQLADAGYTDEHFLLATDTSVVIPTGKVVVIQVTGADVIHAWAMPAFGVKQDAVPGRLAELWFEVDEGMEGVYFGQCSELCGLSHAYMPITVKAVSQADYDAWVAAVQEAGEYVEPGPKVVAAN